MFGPLQVILFALIGLWVAATVSALAQQQIKPESWSIAHELELGPVGAGTPQRTDMAQAMRVLKIPSVSVALIDRGELAWADAFGEDGASQRTLYQAASLSKVVVAVAVMRLIQHGQLQLDQNADDALSSWRIPPSEMSRDHPVTLRGLLSMTGGIGVPGYIGYERGAALPTLVQILDGVPPANSPPVRVEYVPGSRYLYSGGGYQILQAIIQDATKKPSEAALQDLVFQPAGMIESSFAQPLSDVLATHAATGHYADGTELRGGWRVVPELAAGGLWSTPRDLAKLLIAIARGFSGKISPLLDQPSARVMLTSQNGGPYGLGGAVSGVGRSLALMKRGQNIGYQSYMMIFPNTGQGIVVMTGSDNGTTLASAIIRRAAVVYGWPDFGALPD